VGAETHVHTISKEEYEHLKIQLARSQRDNIDIQAELKTTQDRAASKDIQLQREIIQLEQKEKHALQRVHDVQRDVEHKQSELQIIREREIHTVQRARDAQEATDRAEAAL